MKIGLISDIHGDMAGLESALAIFAREDVDRVLCAGDLVERGTDGDRVVQLLQEREIPCVQGNHDEFAPDNQRWLRDNSDLNHPHVRGQLLTEETLAYLQQLPASLRFEWAGLCVLLIHGTPKSNLEFLFPHSPAARFEVIAKEAETDIIICGHTHEPMQVKHLGVRFFNPGSIYNDDARGSHTCATLSLPDCSFTVFRLDSGMPIDAPN